MSRDTAIARLILASLGLVVLYWFWQLQVLIPTLFVIGTPVVIIFVFDRWRGWYRRWLHPPLRWLVKGPQWVLHNAFPGRPTPLEKLDTERDNWEACNIGPIKVEP